MASKTRYELLDEYVEMFDEPFPIYEAVQDEAELLYRMQQCIDKQTSYEILYPIDRSNGKVY